MDEEYKDTEEIHTLRNILFGFSIFDGFVMVAVVVAFITKVDNPNNWLLFFNIIHILLWLFGWIVSGIDGSRKDRVSWFTILGVVAIISFFLDVGSGIWRIIRLVDCYGKDSSNSCRDYLVNDWVTLVGIGLWLVTDLGIAITSFILGSKIKENIDDYLNDQLEEQQLEEEDEDEPFCSSKSGRKRSRKSHKKPKYNY